MDNYRLRYTEREPDFSRIKNNAECFQLSEEHGVIQIKTAPISDPICGGPPRDRNESESDKAKYIWVIRNDSLPMILEKSKTVEFLESGRATHTNLTGCNKAHCGGEVWFKTGAEIYISGASGRFPTRTSQELDDICEAFRRFGYNVTSLGWDPERNWAHKYLRG